MPFETVQYIGEKVQYALPRYSALGAILASIGETASCAEGDKLPPCLERDNHGHCTELGLT